MPIADISVHAAQLAVAIIFNGFFFSTKTSEGLRVVSTSCDICYTVVQAAERDTARGGGGLIKKLVWF